MHACFHGGGGASRVTKSVGIIAKSVKALSLIKARAAGGDEDQSRASRRGRRLRRHWHRRRSPEEAEEPRDKDAAAAAASSSSSASSSAKIAPAQPHDADGDREDPRHPHEEERGGEKHERCDKCCSPLDGGGAGDEEEAAAESDKEWAAEPEPGVLMTLVSRGDGTNNLRRIRFSEEYFGDAWAAQTWWADNCDRIVELYSVVVQTEQPEHGGEDDDPAAPVTPCQSEDEDHQRLDGIGELEYSASCSASASASGGSTSNFSGPSSGSGSGSANKVDSPILGLVTEADSFTRAAPTKHSHKTTRQGQ
ncbi:unnamed protein product [Urochloa decumbens]|uniref:BRX domain-containing protein n=1 Tax=Urochloa decumbens TaxID=240449 RepID=A0ABC9CWB0_9POAL